MNLFNRVSSSRKDTVILVILTLSLALSYFPYNVYSGSMGWVYEDNELRASYQGQTWWMVGEEVGFTTYIVNMEKDKVMERGYADIFLISPSGARINVTRIHINPVYPLRAGSMRTIEIRWDSTDHEAGLYRLDMVGEAWYDIGPNHVKPISNFIDGAVKLFDWEHPVFRPRVVDVDAMKSDYVQGQPFTLNVDVKNEGNVPAFNYM